MLSETVNRARMFHPCYSEPAHRHFARMHLPVAPGCNVQCNYCNRKYDCTNESRPGVVSELLKPEEALAKVRYVSNRMKELSVVGIAGPGDPLANPRETFKTLLLIRQNFPDLILCFSTNGLGVCEHISEIVECGIRYITVTINTFVPATAERIYQWILFRGRKASGKEAMSYLLQKQIEGIRLLVQQGCLVKVNSVLIPGVNDREFPSLAKKIKAMGVYVHNIMPLISRIEYGTPFATQGISEPSTELVERTRKACEGMRQMTHCRQCRADAVGMLNNDVSHLYRKKEYVNLPDSDTGLDDQQGWKAEAVFCGPSSGCCNKRQYSSSPFREQTGS